MIDCDSDYIFVLWLLWLYDYDYVDLKICIFLDCTAVKWWKWKLKWKQFQVHHGPSHPAQHKAFQFKVPQFTIPDVCVCIGLYRKVSQKDFKKIPVKIRKDYDQIRPDKVCYVDSLISVIYDISQSLTYQSGESHVQMPRDVSTSSGNQAASQIMILCNAGHHESCPFKQELEVDIWRNWVRILLQDDWPFLHVRDSSHLVQARVIKHGDHIEEFLKRLPPSLGTKKVRQRLGIFKNVLGWVDVLLSVKHRLPYGQLSRNVRNVRDRDRDGPGMEWNVVTLRLLLTYYVSSNHQ